MNTAVALKPRSPLLEGLLALHRHRGLLWQFTLRNVRMSHRGSYLGLMWLTLNPLFMMCLYAFVFGTIFGGRYGMRPDESALDYALGIFLSLTVFQLFADSMSNATGVIVSSPNLVKKVVFPLEVLPAADVGAEFIRFAVSMALFALGTVLLGHGIQATWLWFPVVLLPVLMMALGVAWLFAAVGVFLRDIAQLTRFLSSILLFGSAVFYSLDRLPPAARNVLYFNPLVHALEQTRAVLLWGAAPEWSAVLYLYGVAVLLLVCGLGVFQRLRPDFADVI